MAHPGIPGKSSLKIREKGPRHIMSHLSNSSRLWPYLCLKLPFLFVAKSWPLRNSFEFCQISTRIPMCRVFGYYRRIVSNPVNLSLLNFVRAKWNLVKFFEIMPNFSKSSWVSPNLSILVKSRPFFATCQILANIVLSCRILSDVQNLPRLVNCGYILLRCPIFPYRIGSCQILLYPSKSCRSTPS